MRGVQGGFGGGGIRMWDAGDADAGCGGMRMRDAGDADAVFEPTDLSY